MKTREKYFYTVLFLDDYFYDENRTSTQDIVETPVLKSFSITNEDASDGTYYWGTDENNQTTLTVKHGLTLPVTLEMWDADSNTLFYTPLLKQGVDSISVGQITIGTAKTIKFIFNSDMPMPQDNEVFKLSVKTLPSFDTTSVRTKTVEREALDEEFLDTKSGLAIIFKRNCLDTHFDLECDIDESYLHSNADSFDMKYMVNKSKFQNVKWLVKYTDNVQDVLDEINVAKYEVKFSWKETSNGWWKN